MPGNYRNRHASHTHGVNHAFPDIRFLNGEYRRAKSVTIDATDYYIKECVMESLIIAVITAIGSIIVALIQATSALQVARIKEQPAPLPPQPLLLGRRRYIPLAPGRGSAGY